MFFGECAGFSVAYGTETGFDHRRAGRNNQDGLFVSANEHGLVAVVCDGCSGEAHSEIGAKIGARMIAEAVRSNIGYFSDQPISEVEHELLHFLERAREDVLAHIRVLAKAMGGSLSQNVIDYFLFTVVGMLITGSVASTFSIGDGVVIINGEINSIGPFPGNEPPYLAYGITGSSVTDSSPELLRFDVHTIMPAEDVQSILIATDGLNNFIESAERNLPGKEEAVGPVSQFWEEDRYFMNPDMVRRRLAGVNRESVKPDWEEGRINRESGLLPDDTTLVVIRRNREEGGDE